MSKHIRISPEEAADRLAIRELVEAYAHCADRRDAKGQMALFTPDTHFVVYMNAKDPGDCTALAEALSEQDAAIFCLGTYTGAVSDADLRKTTVDYTAEFARVLHGSSPNAVFSFLSGSGADQTGRSRLRVIYPVFRVLFPNQVIPADDLARAMVDVADQVAGRRGVVLENRDIRPMAKSR